MASSCHEARQALLECLADSQCYLAGRPIKECVQISASESGCKELNTALFHCRRGQVRALGNIARATRASRAFFLTYDWRARCAQLDMRKRIKGNLYFDGEKGSEDASKQPAAAEAPSPAPAR